MRLTLVDRILDWEAGKSLRAVKNLTLGEEYLADHFPKFPVMPGVLMLQSLIESASWLWRISTEYQYSVIVMREAKNVKYGSFMQPGHQLHLQVELVKVDGNLATFKGKGIADQNLQTVSAQIILQGSNLIDKSPEGKDLDDRLVSHWKRRFSWLSSVGRS